MESKFAKKQLASARLNASCLHLRVQMPHRPTPAWPLRSCSMACTAVATALLGDSAATTSRTTPLPATSRCAAPLCSRLHCPSTPRKGDCSGSASNRTALPPAPAPSPSRSKTLWPEACCRRAATWAPGPTTPLLAVLLLLLLLVVPSLLLCRGRTSSPYRGRWGAWGCRPVGPPRAGPCCGRAGSGASRRLIRVCAFAGCLPAGSPCRGACAYLSRGCCCW